MSIIKALEDVERVYLYGVDVTEDGCLWFDPETHALCMVNRDERGCMYLQPGTDDVARHIRTGQIGLRLFRNAPLQFALDMHAAGVDVSVGDNVHWRFRESAD
jgi:hypothetical protein